MEKHGGYYHRYSDHNGIYIEYDDYGNNLCVRYENIEKLLVHLGEVERFIPGEWTEYIDELSKKVDDIKEKERIKKEKKEIEELKAKWGITEEELVL